MRWMMVAAVMVAAGCAQPKFLRLVPYTTITMEAESGVTDHDLFASAVGMFDDADLPVTRIDESVGIVTTAYRFVGYAEDGTYEDRATSYYHRWRVRIAEGQLRLEIDCGRGDLDPEIRWPSKQCDGNGRAVHIVVLARRIADRINADARDRSLRRKRRAQPPSESQHTIAAHD